MANLGMIYPISACMLHGGLKTLLGQILVNLLLTLSGMFQNAKCFIVDGYCSTVVLDLMWVISNAPTSKGSC